MLKGMIQAKVVSALAVGALVFTTAGLAAPASAADGVGNTGFEQPYAGLPEYVSLAPQEARLAIRQHEPLGEIRADLIASRLGFDKDKALTRMQYAEFVSNRGVGGGTPTGRKSVELVDLSVAYLTNSAANPMYRNIDGRRTEIVLGAYGLIVNEKGMLQSPAIATSPVRLVNWVLAPDAICNFPEIAVPPEIECGYMGKWMRSNGARETLLHLYESAYGVTVPFGYESQAVSEVELVPNTRRDGSNVTTGMAMAPSIWIVNFLLIYALNPELAAKMPAYWAAIPAQVVTALNDSPTYEVPYAEYEEYFQR